jgi:phenylpropionate dioxygenase-like ring-hydroxylating dioxygenase large terminal subunit
MNVQTPLGLRAGTARCDAPSVQEILDTDTRPVPPVLRRQGYSYQGSDDIPAERYFSKAWHDLEVEHVWKKVWQMACREEEIPEVGDHVVYDVVGMSFIVVRSAPGEIKAFVNACLHRGRKLRTEDGASTSFRCPYHGWTWDVTGALTEIPCRWDFPHIDAQNGRLPEARVGTWGGFVFINPDPGCEPLESYLGELPEHFARWRLEDCYKAVHVKKRMPANWKVCAEAFIESYHVIDTHPQIMPHTADANTQYDNYEGQHFNRMITPMGVPSPHLAECSGQRTVDAMVATSGRQVGAVGALALPEGQTARAFMAEVARRRCAELTGIDYADASDSEMLDAIQYFVFPNFFPWGGFSPNIVYRFRPDGNDPESAIVEIMILHRFDPSKPRPAPVPVHEMRDDEVWADARELGGLGAVFDQDMSNIPYVQEGLHATTVGKNAVSLGDFQESRIRDLHRTLERYIQPD